MRKNLLAIGLLAIGFSTSAQILTYVGKDALVTVTSGALVYNGGGMNVVASSTDPIVQDTIGVKNWGNIMVVGAATDQFAVADNSFVLKADNANTYGQLYISGLGQEGFINGKVNKEYFASVKHSATGKQQLALPFYNLTLGELDELFGGGKLNFNGALTTSGRWAYNTVARWNNSKSRYDHVTNASEVIGKSTDYIIVPHLNSDGKTSFWTPTAKNTFKGVPVSDTNGQTVVPIQVSDVASFGTGGASVNYYREKYNSYLTDPFHTGTAWEGNYGKNIMQFANPFLTNLDLYNIKAVVPDANIVEGVAYFDASSFTWSQTKGVESPTLKMAKNSGGLLQAGPTDPADNFFMIKPMGEVSIKFSVRPTGDLNLNPARKFSDKSEAVTVANPTAKISETAVFADKLVKQVAVVALDGSNNELGRTYYAVSPSAVTGFSLDARLQGAFNGAALYTKEETTTGAVDTNSTYQLYINEANEVDYKGKEISLTLNNDNIRSFKFLVYEGGKYINQLSNGNNFYIIQDNKVTQIKHGDTMPINAANYSLTYGRPNTSAVFTPPGLAKKETVVAKKEADWVVRFADTWKSANIEVYDAAGRLMHTATNISTLSDYIIPINGKVKGILVVKATSDTGEIVTKKITK